jgi:hypothetical protein
LTRARDQQRNPERRGGAIDLTWGMGAILIDGAPIVVQDDTGMPLPSLPGVNGLKCDFCPLSRAEIAIPRPEPPLNRHVCRLYRPKYQRDSVFSCGPYLGRVKDAASEGGPAGPSLIPTDSLKILRLSAALFLAFAFLPSQYAILLLQYARLTFAALPCFAVSVAHK